MAEETPNENTEETPVEAAEAPEATATPEPMDEQTGATPRAAADAAAAAPSEPEEVVAPKERRARARAAKAAKTEPTGPRTPQERHEERIAVRRQKAQQRRTSRLKARAKAQHTGAEETPPRERAPGVQKVRQGVVTSDKADKTITVRIDVARRHRRYQKIVRTSNTLHAHDESNDANLGDTVIVREARPLSRTKRWRLVQVVERAK
ncbi:MAG: small subunit ribosomal protein [Solirubrobacteraceae bacterium]|jgi:small subunit ribosomal protein S17|nr:small subunit ribosomal protein [Solirubrobacteraceae bacterium]